MNENTRTKTKILAQCGMLLALGVILSKIEIPIWIHGGSITLASMVPLVFISYLHGTKWGVGTAFLYSMIQMFLGFSNVLYCKTLSTQILCIFLDYILAYTCLGFASLIGGKMKTLRNKIILGTGTVCFIRFLASFLSGVLIWGEYAPAEQSVWVYSFLYNGGYMLPETIITVGAMLLLMGFLKEKMA